MMKKEELISILECDAKANGMDNIKYKKNGEIWDYIFTMRKTYFYDVNLKKSKYKLINLINLVLFKIWNRKWHNLSIRLGFSTGYKNIGKGFSIAHYGLLTINKRCVLGEYCRVHEGVCIGSTNKGDAPKIGNYVFIGTGAKIIGDISIADYVQIGANAVVTKSITEPHTTWAGIPAKKISNNDSRSNLYKKIFE